MILNQNTQGPKFTQPGHMIWPNLALLKRTITHIPLHMPTDLNQLGLTKLEPAPEETLLDEEKPVYPPKMRFSRLLMSFQITANGVPSALTPFQLRTQRFEGVEVVGVIGVLFGKAGMFAQAGWFGGENDLDWMWVCIKEVKGIEVRRDNRFRKGELCVWLRSAHGDYALGLPRREYIDMWEETMYIMGKSASGANFEMWPRSGCRPAWWDSEWQQYWPFDQAPATSSLRKRPASISVEELRSASQNPFREGFNGPSFTNADYDAWGDVAEIAHIPDPLFHQRAPWILKQGGLHRREARGGDKESKNVSGRVESNA